jgi:hypothetical protein
MQLFVHSNIGNYNFCQIKINDKVRNMIVALHAAALLFWCCVVFAKVEKKFKFHLSMCWEI